MASLYYKFGSMNCGKSLQLQIVAHNYEEQGKNVLVFKAAQDNREGVDVIHSRVGLSRKAIPVFEETDIFDIAREAWFSTDVSCVLVDEAQFLKKRHIEQLANIVDTLGIPVMAFGLKNDYRNELFEGSKYLLLTADNIEEMKTICHYCEKKATMISLFKDGKVQRQGEQVIIDNEENRKRYTYRPTCRRCWHNADLYEIK
jgi:thymidine kinase